MILKKLHQKLDTLLKEHRETAKEMDTRLDNLEKVTLLQEANLKAHMKRSDHLEQIVNIESEKREKAEKKMEKHVNMVEGAFKLVGLISLVVTIIGGVAKMFGVI